jgi:hypothetical protein
MNDRTAPAIDGDRWKAVDATCRDLGVRMPTASAGVAFYSASDSDTRHQRCDLCGEPCASSLCRLVSCPPPVLVHEACHMLEFLAECYREDDLPEGFDDL